MKKMIVVIMSLVVMFTLIPAAKAYACECTCDACKNCKEKEEEKKTSKKTAKQKLAAEKDKLLKQISKTAKKYGWVIETETVKSSKKELIVNVKLTNPDKRMYMDDMQIIAKKSNGTYVADWYFFKESEAAWKHTNSDRINKVLAED